MTNPRSLIDNFTLPFPDIVREHARRREIIAGAGLTAAEAMHSRIAREFGSRLSALGTGKRCIIADFTWDDFSSPPAIRQTLMRRYRELTGSDDGSRLNAEETRAFHLDASAFGNSCNFICEENGFKKPCMLIIPPQLTMSLQEDIALFLHISPDAISENLPLSLEEHVRMTHYHEGFGHFTEPGEWCSGLPANRELRADIAAMIGIIHDTGNMNAAKARIYLRDLSALRITSHNGRPPLAYIHGSHLREAFNIISGMKNINALDDRGIVSETGKVFAAVRMTRHDIARESKTLTEAFRMAQEPGRKGSGEATVLLESCKKAAGVFLAPAPW